MSLFTADSLNRAVHVGSREHLLRRLFSTVDTEVYTWEHTLGQMGMCDIPSVFANCMEEFADFLNTPTKELFDAWHNLLLENLEDDGVLDDWNASNVFHGILSARFDSFDISSEERISPFNSASEVANRQFENARDGICVRAFATIVIAIASTADKSPTMQQVAEDLLAESERLVEQDEEEGEGEGEEEEEEE